MPNIRRCKDDYLPTFGASSPSRTAPDSSMCTSGSISGSDVDPESSPLNPPHPTISTSSISNVNPSDEATIRACHLCHPQSPCHLSFVHGMEDLVKFHSAESLDWLCIVERCFSPHLIGKLHLPRLHVWGSNHHSQSMLDLVVNSNIVSCRLGFELIRLTTVRANTSVPARSARSIIL